MKHNIKYRYINTCPQIRSVGPEIGLLSAGFTRYLASFYPVFDADFSAVSPVLGAGAWADDPGAMNEFLRFGPGCRF
jgi:hypothetical protein